MNNILKDIKDNWVLVAFIASLIVGWTSFNNRLSHVEAQAEENKTTLEQLVEIKQDLTEIKTDISWIKNNLN